MDIQSKIIEKAEQANFQLLTNEPAKLEKYFIQNVLSPIVDSITRINNNFYGITFNGQETKIRLIDKFIIIDKKEDSVHFYTDYNDGYLTLLKIEFSEGKATSEGKLLTKKMLLKAIEEVFED